MDKPLQRAQKISGTLVRELQPALTSVYLFGSAARDEYIPGRSDLNLLLIFDELDRNSLKKTSVLQREIRRRSHIDVPDRGIPSHFPRHLPPGTAGYEA
ncbi:MAG: nucleotidyltransferase domain-containing protein [candidate division Zixibacteria bacterium]|nr:nucleotidyltransferase domain-containing protein [Candidatus Tariuqbacter arcticus]